MSKPTRQNLGTLGGLNRTERAVLTQVVELAENGEKGCCYAKNETLGQRVRANNRTGSRYQCGPASATDVFSTPCTVIETDLRHLLAYGFFQPAATL